ncbi:beta strand repeat-containing protein [Bdellovibrio bacteriovorus]|uniref:beta strand repeat-containing protein n=1 Tax=Bdellovibrio bacteriovorus TaxID=959 RepID=UPI0035A94232
MKCRYVRAIFFMSLFWTALAYAGPGSLTYQGRIKNSDGQALEVDGVKFEFSIMNPTGTCVLYKETSTAIDMRNSSGVFDVPIGTGTKNYPGDPSFKLLDSFDNSTTLNCESGGTYVPVADDKRLLRVQFYDGTGWKLISPDSDIRSVPYAGHAKVAQSAQKLGNNSATDFILKSNVPLCAAGQYLRHIAPAGTFECTAPSVSGSNVTGNISGSSAGFTGNLVGDVSGTQSTTSVDKIKGVALDMTGIASGKVLKYNGTTWAPADDNGTAGALTGLSGDVTSTGSPTATVTLSDSSVTSTKISDGTIVNADISATAAIVDTKLATISTAGKVSGDAITSGTIGGSTAINTSGAITSASVSTSTLGVNTLQIYKTGNGNKVTITVPSSLTPDYSLQLPGDDGTSGQILSTDGNGVLSWVNPSSGSVTSVGATAPLASTGGATPVISLNDSGVTAGTYAKVTVNAKGLVTGNTSLAAGDIPNLSGDVTSTGGSASTKVEKIQGVAVASTTPLTGQVVIHNGTQWTPGYFGMGQLRSTVTGNTQVPASCSTADKTLTWSAITDSFSCTTISIANTQITGLGTASTKNFGTAAGNLVELDGAGRIPASLLPAGGYVTDGGNTTGATLVVGTNDGQSLSLETNNASRLTIDSAGNVGVGTASPTQKLEVSGRALVQEMIITGGLGTDIIRFGASPYNGEIYYVNSTNKMYFDTNNSPRMVIDSSGNVGIGTTNPGYKLQVNETSTSTAAGDAIAAFNYMWANPASSSATKFTAQYSGAESGGSAAAITGGLLGQVSYANHYGANSLTKLSGSWSGAGNKSTGTVTTAVGAQGEVNNDSTGTITYAMGLHSTVNKNSTGAITNAYGLYVDQVQGTNKWSVYANDATAPSYFAGNVGVGTTTPSRKLAVAGVAEVSDAFYMKEVNSASNSFDAAELSTYMWDNTAGSEGSGLSVYTKVNGTRTAVIDFTDEIYIYSPLRVETDWSYLERAENTVYGHWLYFQKARGNYTTTAAVQSGDELMNIAAMGATGTAYNWSGYSTNIRAAATETFTAGGQGAKLMFQTAANGTTTAATRMTIDHNGNVGIGTTAPTERLDLGGGNIKVGHEIVMATQVAGAAAGWYYANCPAGKYATGGACASGSGTMVLNSDVTSTAYGCYKPDTSSNIQIKVVCMNVR